MVFTKNRSKKAPSSIRSKLKDKAVSWADDVRPMELDLAFSGDGEGSWDEDYKYLELEFSSSNDDCH